jgi:hypothetical protein
MRAGVASKPASQKAVLTKATLRAAALLGLKDAELARIIGVSAATLSRLHRDRTIDPVTKEGELALLFVRLVRSLDAVLSGNEAATRAWFDAHNHALRGVPRELVTTTVGLVHVLEYLDAIRAKN